MAKKKKSHGGVDPLDVEVFIRVRQPKVKGKVVEISNKVLQQAMTEWFVTGKLPPGIEVFEMRWRNPARRSQELRGWRSTKDAGQTMEAARTTLNIGNWFGARMHRGMVSLKVRRKR
jgi:hypothetical protein